MSNPPHFYIVQGPFVHVQNPHELTSRPFCTRAKPSCKRSMPFCSRCKPAWSHFKAFLYTCKTVMQAFKPLLHTAQNRPANVQGPLVPCVKPPCKCSEPHCSWYKNDLPEREPIINSHRHDHANGLLRWSLLLSLITIPLWFSSALQSHFISWTRLRIPKKLKNIIKSTLEN